jgi:hypothetical protein
MCRVWGTLVLFVAVLCATGGAALGQCVRTETKKLTATPGNAQDITGYSVATNGSVAVCGAPGFNVGAIDGGAVFVFTPASGGWVQTRLTPADLANGDNFGRSVAIDGAVLVAGAPWADTPASNAGAAHVFRFNGTSWVWEAKLLPPDGATNDNFGAAVAISGNLIAVGAPNNGPVGVKSGSAYVYHYTGAGWSYGGKLRPADAVAGDSFGWSLAARGDRVLVGAPQADNPGDASGAAYVFRFDGAGWSLEQKLAPPDPQEGDSFGNAVAGTDGRVVVGAWGRSAKNVSSGSAVIFAYDGLAWNFEVELQALDAAAGDNFGGAVAISGSRVICGAAGNDDGGSNTGSIYVFEEQNGVWSQRAKLNTSDATTGDNFGAAVGAADGWAVAGAPDNDDSGASSGSLYVFTGMSDCNGNNVLDICDLGAGLPDCNGNGLPDVCDIASGLSHDVNANGVPDECEPDCNHNGLPDAWEIATQVAGDCNGNGQPDTCDIRDGLAADCDGDEVPDQCQVLGPYTRTSANLGPFGYGHAQALALIAPPLAGGTVTITITAISDLAALAEWADVDINGVAIGRVFQNNGHDCPPEPDVAVLTLTSAAYNQALGAGNATIHVVPNAQVDPLLCPASYVKISISYSAVGPDDCNANGVPDLCDVLAGTSQDRNGNWVPDECEAVLRGDCSCDGAVNFGDINPFVQLLTAATGWQTAHPGCSPLVGDINQDGQVSFADINPFVALLTKP